VPEEVKPQAASTLKPFGKKKETKEKKSVADPKIEDEVEMKEKVVPKT